MRFVYDEGDLIGVSSVIEPCLGPCTHGQQTEHGSAGRGAAAACRWLHRPSHTQPKIRQGQSLRWCSFGMHHASYCESMIEVLTLI